MEVERLRLSSKQFRVKDALKCAVSPHQLGSTFWSNPGSGSTLVIALRPWSLEKSPSGAAPRPERPLVGASPPKLMRLFQSQGSPETETVSHIPSQQTETIPPFPCDVHDTSGAMPTVPTSAPSATSARSPTGSRLSAGVWRLKIDLLAKKANALRFPDKDRANSPRM